jgi:lysophospholipase L1-like esterase
LALYPSNAAFFCRPRGVLFILLIWAGLCPFLPERGEAQNQLYLPLVFNTVCSKDLVFLAFGDSITSCYMDTDLCAFPRCGYPQRLYDRLKSRFISNFAYFDVGIGGERTSDGVARLADTVHNPEVYNVAPIFCPAAPSNLYPPGSTNTVPDLIIIMEGTNDVGDWAARDYPSLETIAANIRSLALTSLQSGLKVILATLTPVVPIDEHRALQGQGVALLNYEIRQIAADYQIPLADVFSFFINHPNWESELMSTALEADGLHPNDLGFAVMAEVFYQTLLPLMTSAGCLIN